MKRIAFVSILIVAIYLVGLDLDLAARSYAQSNTLRPYELYWKKTPGIPNVKINDIIDDPIELGQLVRDIAGKPMGGNVGHMACRLARMIKPTLPVCSGGPSIIAGIPRSLAGLEGMFTHPIVLAANSKLNAGETTFVRFHGEIVGYHYNDSNGSGFLKVETVSYTEDLNNVISNFTQHEWTISIHPGTYIVAGKTGGPDNPFPLAEIEFPQEILDEFEPGGELEHITHKLFAKGEGIDVLLIKENGVPLSPSHYLYNTDENSCIDILFDQTPPANDLPEKPHYCLGRCGTPQIIGTM